MYKRLLLFTVLSCLLLGCENERPQTISTTRCSSSYWSMVSGFELTDEEYFRNVELDEDDWSLISENLHRADKNRWRQNQIEDWLFHVGLNEADAASLAEWMSQTDHAVIFVRFGTEVEVILK